MKNTLIVFGILIVILVVAFIATNMPAENKCSKKGKCTGPFGLCFRCDRRFPAFGVGRDTDGDSIRGRRGIYGGRKPLYPDTRYAARRKRMF